MKSLTIKIVALLCCLVVGTLSVIFLFQQSEKSIQYTNSFIRQFPPHFATEVHQADLGFNSYYFSGIEDSTIYLGNITAPLQMLLLDTLLQRKEQFFIELNEKHLPFHKPQVKVNDTNFYVYEGSIPYLFQGSVFDWKASLKINTGNFFSQVVPIDSVRNAVRYIAPQSGENIIGVHDLRDTADVNLSSTLLEKQLDGIIDTDGTLLYNKQLDLLCYMHRYRNEFTVFKPSLALVYRGKTIDTISKSTIELKEIKGKSIKTFASPPLIVNKSSATYGNFLFNHSMLRGQFELAVNWKNASIIDVYDLVGKRYVLSFYVYHIGDSKMKSFTVDGHTLYALIGDKIVKYQLRSELLNKYE